MFRGTFGFRRTITKVRLINYCRYTVKPLRFLKTIENFESGKFVNVFGSLEISEANGLSKKKFVSARKLQHTNSDSYSCLASTIII